MIVCVCNNVSDKAVRQAVASGVSSLPELRTVLNIGTCCGKCTSCARSILHESRAAIELSETMTVIPLHRLLRAAPQARGLAA